MLHTGTRFFCSGATEHDVVVVGGGMVGATLACLLGTGKVGSVCLIDPTIPQTAHIVPPKPDLRVSAISPGSAEILRTAGAWPPARSTEFRKMRVWDHDGGQISFDGSDNSLGYITENSLLLSSLHTSLLARGVAVYQTAALSLNRSANGWPIVQLGEKYNAVTGRLVIGADGGKSVVRSSMAAPTAGWSYSQMGVVATIAHPPHVKNITAWQRFLPSGPIALLPLHDNYSSIVWSTNVPHAEYLMALDDLAFINAVQNAFTAPVYSHGLLADLAKYAPYFIAQPPSMPKLDSVVGKRGAFPLRFEHSLNYVGNRVALVGDAAHTVHPLAGQGVNLGLTDAAVLASLVTEAAATGTDIGSSSILEAYERSQKKTELYNDACFRCN